MAGEEPGWFPHFESRALLELKGWLIETYNEAAEDDDEDARYDKIKFCYACKDIITMV